jgi:hypothetical protein
VITVIAKAIRTKISTKITLLQVSKVSTLSTLSTRVTRDANDGNDADGIKHGWFSGIGPFGAWQAMAN